MLQFKKLGIFFLILCSVNSFAQEEPVVFNDINLKNALLSLLEKSQDAEIYPAEMQSFSKLELARKNISDLTGLEYATGLTHLDLYYNKVSDISPILSLHQLTWLNLERNSILEEPKTLAELPVLHRLMVRGNGFMWLSDTKYSYHRNCQELKENPDLYAGWRIVVDPDTLNCDFDNDGVDNFTEFEAGMNVYRAESYPIYKVKTPFLDFSPIFEELSGEAGYRDTLHSFNLVQDDFDNDGDMDWVAYFNGIDETEEDRTCNYDCGEDYTGSYNGKLVAYENREGQYLRVALADERPSGDQQTLQSFDVNNDGRRDLLAAFRSEVRLYISEPGTSAGFSLVDRTEEFGLDKRSGVSVIADLNADGYPDLIPGGSFSPLLYEPLLGDDGVFGSSGKYVAYQGDYDFIEETLRSYKAVDVNNDRKEDILAYREGQGFVLLINKGNMEFEEKILGFLGENDPLIKFNIVNVLVMDVENDGDNDFAVIINIDRRASESWVSDYDYHGYQVAIYKNEYIESQSIGFSLAYTHDDSTYGFTNGGNFIDFDVDGDLDLIVSHYDERKTLVLRNNGDMNWESIDRELGFLDSGNKVPLMTDFDLDGQLDLVVPGGEGDGSIDYALSPLVANNPYFRVRVRGADSGTDASGAKVHVIYTDDYSTTIKPVQHKFGDSRDLWFGLGEHPGAIVFVLWPNGEATFEFFPQIVSGQLIEFDEPIHFSDAALRQLVTDALGYPVGTVLYQQDMLSLTALDLANANIADISPLRHARNLTTLDLSNNDIADYGAIANLSNLSQLVMSDNPYVNDACLDTDGDQAPDYFELEAGTSPFSEQEQRFLVQATSFSTGNDLIDLSGFLSTYFAGIEDQLDVASWHPYWEDLDKDGDLDLAVYIDGQQDQKGLFWLFDNVAGNHYLRAASRFDGSFNTMLGIDYDHNGTRDLLLTTTKHTLFIKTEKNAYVGGFTCQDISQSIGLSDIINIDRVAMFDSNRNGQIELVISQPEVAWLEYQPFAGEFRDIYSATHLPDANSHWKLLASADVNNDGLFDLLVQEATDNSGSSSGLTFYVADAAGHFTEAAPHGLYNHYGQMSLAQVLVVDMNNDGAQDLVIFENLTDVAQGYRTHLLLNDFASLAQVSFIENSLDPVLGDGLLTYGGIARDFDADGDLDLLVAANTAGKSSVIFNLGGGQVSSSELESMGLFNKLPQAQDFDGDFDVDLIMPGESMSGYFGTSIYSLPALNLRLSGSNWSDAQANPDVWGAKVFLSCNGKQVTRWLTPGYGTSYTLRIGLGCLSASDPATFTIQWPSGEQEDYSFDPEGATYEIQAPAITEYGRHQEGLLAYYDFSEGAGLSLFNQVESQSSTRVPLMLRGAEGWLADRNGFEFSGDQYFIGNSPLSTINDFFRFRKYPELGFDIWLGVTAGETGTIVDLHNDDGSKFFTLYQEGDTLVLVHNLYSRQSVSIPITSGTYHIAFSHYGYSVNDVYVNGELFSVYGDYISVLPEPVVNRPITLGNSALLDAPWNGTIYQMALYVDRITPSQVIRNFRDGASPLLYDEDGDGVRDSVDAHPIDSLIAFDSDNDGVHDGLDPDDDGDGVLDIADQYPNDASVFSDDDPSDVMHVLKRLTFGINSASVAKISSLGIDGFIAEQLDPESIMDSYSPPANAGSNIDNLRNYHFEYLAYSDRQLLEVMTLFWENHFSTYYNKHRKPEFEHTEQLRFRANALGKFEDLLITSATSPAMLVYLDNYGSRTQIIEDGVLKESTPNENYAREMLELHTVGVLNASGGGNYNNADVVAASGILSGWSITVDYQDTDGDGDLDAVLQNQFEFKPDYHFDITNPANYRSVMGQVFPQTGKQQGDVYLSYLAQHASTANYICTKLMRVFVDDNTYVENEAAQFRSRMLPETLTLLDNCKADFMSSGGDIKVILENLFRSPEFYSDAIKNTKVKTPIEYLASAARAFGVTTSDVIPAPSSLRGWIVKMGELGMNLYLSHQPDGFPEVGGDWIGTSNFSSKFLFAYEAGKPNVSDDDKFHHNFFSALQSMGLVHSREIINFVVTNVLGGKVTQKELEAMRNTLDPVNGRPFLMTHQDAEKRVNELIALVLASPSFQFQ